MKQDRLIWLDASKGIGLILVILGHNLGFIEKAPYWHGFIYSFHMPLFFFLSGCTLNLASAKDSLRRASIYAYSYLLMATLIMPIAMILTHNYHPLTLLGGILYGTGHTIDVSPLWFLSCLAITLVYISIFIAVLSKIGETPNNPTYSLLGGLVFLMGGYYAFRLIGEQCVGNPAWGNVHQSGAPWNAEVAITAAGYLLLGKYFSKYCHLLSIKPQSHQLLIFIASSLLLYFIYSEGLIHYDLNFRHIGPYSISAYVPLIGIIACTALGCIASNIKYVGHSLSQLGQSGLIVLWLHSGIQNKAIKLAFDQVHIKNNALLWTTSFFAASITPVLINFFVIKRSPLLNRIFYPRFKFNFFK